MIATQVKFNNSTSYSYDSSYDTLRVTFNYSQDFYYDEPFPSFLIRYKESNDEIIGVQILNVKNFNENNLLKFLDRTLATVTLAILKDLFD